MNWREYQSKAIQTVTHGTREKALSCFLFGMLGEWAELDDKINNSASEDLVKKELGDFSWYLANYTNAMGIHKISSEYVNFVVYEPWKVIAEFQEKNKKWYRDKNWELDEEDLKVVNKYVGILYGLFNEVCTRRNYNPSDIYTLNIEKLFSRKKRGTISGSGDER